MTPCPSPHSTEEFCPAPFTNELLPDAPSRWFLTGFLVPAEASVEQKSDEGADSDLVARNNKGLTYNRFHDPQERPPDTQTLRALHARMDAAVLAAYSWTDLPTACDFILDYEDDEAEAPTGRKRKKPWRYRWPDDIRDEVLARLLKLNAERAHEEKLDGLAAAAAAPANRRKGERGKGRGGAAPQSDLLPPPQKDLFG